MLIKCMQMHWSEMIEMIWSATAEAWPICVADHIISTGHNIKWDHFEILASGKSDLHCKIKETLLISDLKPSLNENVGSEKLFLY